MLTEEIYYADSIESRFDQAMEYLDYMYHTYPTEISEIPLSAEQSVEMASLSVYAGEAGKKARRRGGTPLGLLVV